MAQNINQFSQTPVLGDLDLEISTGAGSVISAVLNTGTVVAGTAMKWATTTFLGGPPQVAAATAGDQVCGFVIRNLKDQSVTAANRLELAGSDSAIWLTANAAIARGQAVEAVVATPGLVQASGGILPVVGYALDTALNNGDLIRVVLTVPTGVSGSNVLRTATVVATLAQVNAGLVLIPGITGKKITVVDYLARAQGSFAGGTNVILESTNGSPVVVTTIAEAALTSGTANGPFSANNTVGAGFGAPLGSGDGLQLVSTGTQTTATSLTVTITYSQG
jgi:hypothetical protein